MNYEDKKEDVEISLSYIFNVLKEKWIFVLLITAVFGAVGAVYNSTRPVIYSSEAMYTVFALNAGDSNTIVNGSAPTISALTSQQISMSRVYKDTYAQDIAQNNTLLRTLRLWLIAKYGYTDETAPSQRQLPSMFKIVNDPEEYFAFSITVSTSSLELTDDLNRALASIVDGSYTDDPMYPAYVAYFNAVTPIAANADKEAIATFTAGLKAAGVAVETEAEALAIADNMRDIQSRISDPAPYYMLDTCYVGAFVEDTAIYCRDLSEQPTAVAMSLTYTLAAAAIGLILSCVFFILLRVFDTRIRTEEDLRKVCPYPVLGAIPAMHSKN